MSDKGNRGIPRLQTPEGDALVLAKALYRHRALGEISQRLREADDFGWHESPEPDAEGSIQIDWYETPRAVRPRDHFGRRVLAILTLTPTTLEVETMSRQRRRACRRRLAEILGDRIQLVKVETRTVEEALAEPLLQPEPPQLPPEVLAEMEDRMLRQWIEEPIPALAGMTPREAAQSAMGRKMLDDLFDYIARQQASSDLPPGMFSPDYRKARKMLRLE